jgi:O-antigen/teichoic acid export membrane protein
LRSDSPLTLLVGRLLTASLGFIQLAVLARLLPLDEFGRFAIVTAISAYLQMIVEPILTGYERLGAKAIEKDTDRETTRSVAFSVLLLSLSIVTIVCIVVGWLQATAIMGAAIGVTAVSNVQTRWVLLQYLNFGQRGSVSRALIVNALARLVGIFICLMVSSDAAAVALVGAAVALAATHFVSPVYPRLSLQFVGLAGILKVGTPTALTAAAGVSLVTLPVLIYSHNSLPEQFAVFAAQWTLAQAAFISTAGYLLVFGFAPAKALWDDGDESTARATVMSFLYRSSAISALLLATYVLAGQGILRSSLGEDFQDIGVLVASTAVSAITTIATTIGWLMRLQFRQLLLSGISATVALLQLPVLWLSASNWGSQGVLVGAGVVALLCSMVVVVAERASPIARCLTLGSMFFVVVMLS